MKTSTFTSISLTLLAALAASACRDGRAASRAERGAGEPRAAADAPSLDPRDQYALARAIEEAEALGDDGAALALAEVRRDWLGKRLRWQVHVIPALCKRPDLCHVLPFDRAGPDRAVVHGWMPELHLDLPTFAALQATCAGKPRCTVSIEATLGGLELSTEYPTSLAFHDVRVP
jgi:hypothetical protein